MSRMNAPDQNGMGNIFFIGDHIKQLMNSITQINISRSAFAVHGFRSCRSSPAVSMRGAINDSGVRFCFCNDATGKNSVESCKQIFSQQLFCYQHHIIAYIEGLSKFHLGGSRIENQESRINSQRLTVNSQQSTVDSSAQQIGIRQQ